MMMKHRVLSFVQLLIFILVIALGNSNIHGQSCYVQLDDLSGYDSSPFQNSLEDEACLLREAFPTEFQSEFKVYDMGFFLHMSSFTESYEDTLLAMAQNEGEFNSDYFLVLAKETDRNGIYSQFHAVLKLPQTGAFSEISEAEVKAISNYLELIVQEKYPTGSAPLQSEQAIIAALVELRVIITGIVDGTFELSETALLELHGFIEIQIDDTPLVHTGSVYSDDLGFYDYTGLEDPVTNEKIRDAALLAFVDGDAGYIFTDSENIASLSGIAQEKFSNALLNFEEDINPYTYWYHFMLPQNPGDTLRMFAKVGVHLTEEELFSFVYNAYLDGGILALQGSKGNAETRSSISNCGLTTEWRTIDCLIPYYSNFKSQMIQVLGIDPSIPTEQIDYRIGVYCGVLDGALDVAMLIVNGAKFAYEKSGRNLFETEWYQEKSWYAKLWIGVKVVITTSSNPVLGLGLVFLGDDALEFSYELAELIADDKFGEILSSVKTAIQGYFADLTFQNGTILAGHAAGIAIFEIAGFIGTAGVSGLKTGVSLTAKGMKLTKGVQTVRNVMDEGLAAIGQGAKWARCKILMQGCFLKDTPVLIARASGTRKTNAVRGLAMTAAAIPVVSTMPIQDVQLLDYVVAHKTVNAEYPAIASTSEDETYPGLLDNDPYTSDQQRERDRYVLDDQNWHEVIFEQVHGSSVVKLALHNDHVTHNEYQVNEIVDINLPEQGISGPFRITSLRHILPQKMPMDENEWDSYEPRPVTGLFMQLSESVWDVILDNGDIISVTSNHPVFSVTMGDWRLVEELDVGESVLTMSGPSTVKNMSKRSGAHRVYNLEVRNLHNFLVGRNGLVVHNNCWKWGNSYKYADGWDLPENHIFERHAHKSAYNNRNPPPNKLKSEFAPEWSQNVDDLKAFIDAAIEDGSVVVTDFVAQSPVQWRVTLDLSSVLDEAEYVGRKSINGHWVNTKKIRVVYDEELEAFITAFPD